VAVFGRELAALSPAGIRAVRRDLQIVFQDPLASLTPRMTASDGTLIVTSTATRDQIANRADAMSKLALIVAAALDRPKPRKPTKPSKGAKRRRVADKRRHAEKKANRRGGAD
jgi:ribosome-associated protein